MRRVSRLGIGLSLLAFSFTYAQEKKPEKKDYARVCVCVPLGIPTGVATRVVIRGQKLDTATELRFLHPNVTARILKHAKSPPPQKQEPQQVGDTVLEAEITFPAGMAPGDGHFVVVTPSGATAPHQLLVNQGPVLQERESNNGFKQAQPVAVPLVLEGAVSSPQDVDVFRFEGQAGQRIVGAVLAARLGSGLDASLTLFSAGGRIVASNDDHQGSADPRIEVVLPETGTYYLSLSDAHDQGGPAHVYRLVIDVVK